MKLGEEHYLEKYHKLLRICDDNWFMILFGELQWLCMLQNTDLILNLVRIDYRDIQGDARLFFYLFIIQT